MVQQRLSYTLEAMGILLEFIVDFCRHCSTRDRIAYFASALESSACASAYAPFLTLIVLSMLFATALFYGRFALAVSLDDLCAMRCFPGKFARTVVEIRI